MAAAAAPIGLTKRDISSRILQSRVTLNESESKKTRTRLPLSVRVMYLVPALCARKPAAKSRSLYIFMKALIKGNIAVNIPGVTQPTNPSVSRYSISANMLRAASNAGAGRRPWGMLKIGVTDYVARRTMSSLQEALVRITFVDVEGERETVPGLPGQNILQVAEKHEIALDGPCEGRAGETQKRNSTTWTEDLFGQGPVCACCHVMIPKEFTDKIEPPLPHEIGLLERKGELYAPGASRLACQIKLSKELNGMTVYIPDGPPVS